MTITLLSPALGEILEAIDYYDEQAIGLGAKLDADLEATLRLISDHPAVGSPYERGTRRVLLDRFPFSDIYRELPDRILVVAFAHQRRRPVYWADRV